MTTSDGTEDASLSRETEQRLVLVMSRYPDRFDDAQVEQLQARIERSIKLGLSLRATTLLNGDGPDLVVTALPPGSLAE